MYLLDTNIVSELRRKKPHSGVVAWLQTISDNQLYLSVVTLAEIQAGIEITREQDSEKADELENWLNLIAQTYNILPIDAQTFRIWAKIMHRKSDTLYEDAMIAATAKVRNLTVVTRNIKDFKYFDVTLFNPFDNKAY